MSRFGLKRFWLGALLAGSVAICTAAPVAQAAHQDPLYIYQPDGYVPKEQTEPRPIPPPPDGTLEGACGLAVDFTGTLVVSDYYHDTVDSFDPTKPLGVFNPNPPPPVFAPEVERQEMTYGSQFGTDDPLSGPCGVAFDSLGLLYVNHFHRSVVRYDPLAPKLPSGVLPGVVLNSDHPTGVAVDAVLNSVYVDNRNHITVYNAAGTELGQIGNGNLVDGYGAAFSNFPATQGNLYVPDAATNTVKVYSNVLGSTNPIATINGSATPNGHFVSLHNAAVAVDNFTGEIYVTDNVGTTYSDHSETVVYVFSSAGAYLGRLKYSIEDALPPGLAVDNSGSATQSRVYVTTGPTEGSAVLVYRSHSATSEAEPLPTLAAGGLLSPQPDIIAGAASAATLPAPIASSDAATSAPEAAAPAKSSKRAANSRPRHRHRAKHARADRRTHSRRSPR